MAMSWSIYKLYIEIESDSIEATKALRGKPNRIISLSLDSDILTADHVIDSITSLQYNKKLIPGKHQLEILVDGWAELKSLSIEGRYQQGLKQTIPINSSFKKDIVNKVIDKSDHIVFEFTTWE